MIHKIKNNDHVAFKKFFEAYNDVLFYYFLKKTKSYPDAEGIGGPHIGQDMIWPMSIIMKALTTKNDEEIKWSIKTLQNTHGNTGFMHESFHKDDPKNFTRSWFAWTNTLFGELLWKTLKEKPNLLS